MRKTGRVNLSDWTTFENLLAKPDAEYEIAFRLFDFEGTGTVKFDEFQKLYNLNKDKDSIPDGSAGQKQGPIDQIRDYKKREHALHRQHRGVMQWKVRSFSSSWKKKSHHCCNL